MSHEKIHENRRRALQTQEIRHGGEYRSDIVATPRTICKINGLGARKGRENAPSARSNHERTHERIEAAVLADARSILGETEPREVIRYEVRHAGASLTIAEVEDGHARIMPVQIEPGVEIWRIRLERRGRGLVETGSWPIHPERAC